MKDNSMPHLFGEFVSGDESAFDRLYDICWEDLYNFAFRMLQDSDLVADVLQDVFCDLWNRREKLSNIENPRAFLLQAVKFQVYKILRKNNYQSLYFRYLERDNTVCHTDIESKLFLKEYMSIFETFITNLPEKRKEIFRLRYEEELTTREISLLMNISQKTVQNQLKSVINDLKFKVLKHNR